MNSKKKPNQTSNKKPSPKDSKIKGLKPTMRIKKRFLLIQINDSKKYDFQTLSYALNEHFLKVLGAHFYGKEALWILKEQFKEKDQQLVLKVKSSGVELVQATLALGIQVEQKTLRFEVINISGTLKGLLK